MVDLIALAQGFNAIRSAGQIAQTMIGLRDSAQLLEKSVELNQKIAAAQNALFEAQAEHAALVKSVGELEKEIADLKSWEGEKQRYALERYEPGTLFYTLKEAEARGEPIHHLCAKCYKNDKPSIVQQTGTLMARQPTHFCPECKTLFHVRRTEATVAANFW